MGGITKEGVAFQVDTPYLQYLGYRELIGQPPGGSCAVLWYGIPRGMECVRELFESQIRDSLVLCCVVYLNLSLSLSFSLRAT